MGNWLSIAPTWWELLQSIVKQGYVYIMWKGDIIKCNVENVGYEDYPSLKLEWPNTYPVRLIEKDYKHSMQRKGSISINEVLFVAYN